MHPLLEAAHRVLRGGERGRLAAGTTLPALVRQLLRRLGELDLDPRVAPEARPGNTGGTRRELDLDLFDGAALERSRLLHAARLLGIRSFTLLAAPDLIARDDLTRLSESWRIALHRDFEASAIEAAAYGPTVREVVAARLLERSGDLERDAEAAARLLIDAALAGIQPLSGLLHRRLANLLVAEPSFVRLARALGHLLYLYRYDPVLRTTGRQDIGELVRLAAEWALVRLESLGHIQKPQDGVDGLILLLEAHERCGDQLELDRQGLIDVLVRLVDPEGRKRNIGDDSGQLPAIRGAALGALWTLGAAGGERLEEELALYASPDELGDFLAGGDPFLVQPWIDRHDDGATSYEVDLTDAPELDRAPLTAWLERLAAELADLLLQGMTRADPAVALTWRRLAERGDALGSHLLQPTIEQLAAELEQRRHQTAWDPRPATTAAKQLAVQLEIASEILAPALDIVNT